MVYAFYDVANVTPDIFTDWLEKVPPQRRQKIERYSRMSDKILSLSAYRLLCIALNSDSVEFTFNSHGKPLLDGINFSMSHTKGCVVVAIDSHPIGVDVEQLRDNIPRVAQRVCTTTELAQCTTPHSFYKLWTLKESYIKAVGIPCPLKSVEFSVYQNEITCSDKKFRCQSFDSEKHVISLCKTSVTPAQLTVLTKL